MRKLTYFLSVLRSPRKIFDFLFYVINDEVYWDSYVRDWRSSHFKDKHLILGCEWKNEEIFLDLLQNYASPDLIALEIGCGGGRITSQAAGILRSINAADVSREMLKECRRSVQGGNISFHKLDGFTLRGFSDSSIDLVFSHDVFAHFSSLQIYPYFQEIRRILKPGGSAIISFYNFVRHFELFRQMSLNLHARRRFPPHNRVHFVTEEMLQMILADLGLEIVEIEKTNYLILVFRKPSDKS